MFVVIVKPDLAVSHDLLVLRKVSDDLVCGMKDILYHVGVDADGGIDEVVRVRKHHRVTAGLDRRADGHDIFDARFARPFDHLVAVVIELAHLEMRVGVDQHSFNLFSKKHN
jgi:hypothetical protein